MLICGMMVLLYAVKMVFERFTNFAGEFGHICLYICYDSIFSFAPVPTFPCSFAWFFLFLVLGFPGTTVIQIVYGVSF